MMRCIGMNPTNEEVVEMIADIDEDQSGSIDFDEFLVMMKTRMDENDPEKELKEAFKVFDQDGDGLIHWKELKVIMDKLGSTLSDQEVHAMIREADRDGDGAIDYEEFKTMMLVSTLSHRRLIRTLIILMKTSYRASNKPTFTEVSRTQTRNHKRESTYIYKMYALDI